METANNYESLLDVLLGHSDKSLKIATNVAPSSIHRGIKKALKERNELITTNLEFGISDEEPLPEFGVSVKEVPRNLPSEPKCVIVSLIDPDAEAVNKFKPKFEFKIVEDTDDDNSNSETLSGNLGET